MIAGDQFLCNVIGNDTNGHLATFQTTSPQNMYYRGDTDTSIQLTVADTWVGGAWDNNNSYVAIYDASTFLSGTLAGDWDIEGDLTVDTDTLVVDATNDRVGINTAPGNAFHIKGTGEIGRFESTSATGNSYCYFKDATGNLGYIGYAAATNDLYLTNAKSSNLLLGTNGLARMTIDSSGNFGVGVAPSVLFHVESAENNNLVSRIVNSGATNPFGLFIGFTNAAPNDLTQIF